MDEQHLDIASDVKLIVDELVDKVFETSTDISYDNVKDNTDLRELYKYVNAVQLDIHRHTNVFIEIWELIRRLITKMVEFEGIPTSISELTGTILTLEASNKKRDNSLTNAHVKANDNKTRIKKFKDVSENIETLEENLKVLQGEMTQFKLDYEEDRRNLIQPDFAVTNARFKYINNRLVIPHTDPRGIVTMKPPKKNIDYSNTKIASDFLILGSSNVMKVKPHLLSREKIGQKVFCPTFTETRRFLDMVEVEKQPNTILFHCDTNDLDNPDFSETRFEDDFIGVL